MSPRIEPDREIAKLSASPQRSAVLDELAAMLARIGDLAASTTGVSDAERIDRITLLEQLRNATAGAQATEIVAFARSQVDQQKAAEVDYRRLGRGIADQVALACKVSPTMGSQRLSTARALWFDLPATFASLRTGQISDWVATLIARETSHLGQEKRRWVDAELAGQDLPSLSPRRAVVAARRLAYQADPRGFVDRARVAERERRVGVRPLPDTMCRLTADLPARDGIAAYAALRQAADSAIADGDPRGRGQIMADTLVDRLTGRTPVDEVDVEIAITLPVGALLDPDSSRPADLHGYGPVPAGQVHDLLANSRGRIFWRRLFTSPGGQIIGGDHRRRLFPRSMARMIFDRDRWCRDPYCDAPIRHLDHPNRHADGGPTNLTNGRGVCERGNYVKEMPGWRVEVVNNGLDDKPHTTITTTPTGHTYQSRAPQPP